MIKLGYNTLITMYYHSPLWSSLAKIDKSFRALFGMRILMEKKMKMFFLERWGCLDQRKNPFTNDFPGNAIKEKWPLFSFSFLSQWEMVIFFYFLSFYFLKSIFFLPRNLSNQIDSYMLVAGEFFKGRWIIIKIYL